MKTAAGRAAADVLDWVYEGEPPSGRAAEGLARLRGLDPGSEPLAANELADVATQLSRLADIQPDNIMSQLARRGHGSASFDHGGPDE